MSCFFFANLSISIPLYRLCYSTEGGKAGQLRLIELKRFFERKTKNIQLERVYLPFSFLLYYQNKKFTIIDLPLSHENSGN